MPHYPSTVAELHAIIDEQKRLIESLTAGIPEATGKEGSTAILTYIARLESELEAYRQRDGER